MPHPGWMRLPYVVANAGFRLGSNAQSLALVEQASGVLGAAKYLFNAQLRHALDDYRKLAGRIHRRTAGAIADLAEDLRTASQAGPADFRAEIGAMLWTLGYGPESRLLRPEHAGTPPLSRRFYRRVVAQSLAAMPHDPLLQYIWLAMKDRPAFNLRDHGELFARINLRYSETILDQALPEPPSQVFAATCIGWFRGNLDREAVQDYLGACELVAAQYPHCDWLVLLRMEALARPLARQFGFLLPEAVAEGDTTFWLRLATLAADLRRTNGLHPEWPAIGSRASVGSFQAIDALADTAAALDVVERSREAALAYWLATIPPLPTATEQEAAGLLLKAEQEKLVWLRGAYFLVLTPVLPIHYRRYGMELREMLDRKRDPLDPDTGRTQFKEIRGELSKLHDDMQQLAPAYAGRRKNPRPSLTELSGILAAHAVG